MGDIAATPRSLEEAADDRRLESVRVVEPVEPCAEGLWMSGEPNAPMTPREYVEAIVLPTLADLLGRRDDRRLAYLACLVVCHVADSLGLAEAAAALGFEVLSTSARKRAVARATKVVQAGMVKRCGSLFDVVLDIANGMKYPDKLPLLPGSERRYGVFGFGPGFAGFDEGRWSFPGLGVRIDDEVLFLDACAAQVLAGFVCAYPARLGSVGLSFLDWGQNAPGLAMEIGWLKWIRTWGKMTPSVAEVWLFGSRAKGTATAASDVDLALVLMPAEQGHDWALGNWMALGKQWQDVLQHQIGRHVSLELFARPGEDEGAPEAKASAILLWRRGPAE